MTVLMACGSGGARAWWPRCSRQLTPARRDRPAAHLSVRIRRRAGRDEMSISPPARGHASLVPSEGVPPDHAADAVPGSEILLSDP